MAFNHWAVSADIYTKLEQNFPFIKDWEGKYLRGGISYRGKKAILTMIDGTLSKGTIPAGMTKLEGLIVDGISQDDAMSNDITVYGSGDIGMSVRDVPKLPKICGVTIEGGLWKSGIVRGAIIKGGTFNGVKDIKYCVIEGKKYDGKDGPKIVGKVGYHFGSFDFFQCLIKNLPMEFFDNCKVNINIGECHVKNIGLSRVTPKPISIYRCEIADGVVDNHIIKTSTISNVKVSNSCLYECISKDCEITDTEIGIKPPDYSSSYDQRSPEYDINKPVAENCKIKGGSFFGMIDTESTMQGTRWVIESDSDYKGNNTTEYASKVFVKMERDGSQSPWEEDFYRLGFPVNDYDPMVIEIVKKIQKNVKKIDFRGKRDYRTTIARFSQLAGVKFNNAWPMTPAELKVLGLTDIEIGIMTEACHYRAFFY